ncbi:hypothetical protein N0V90_000328 [Kalmusia sp. IMI 367209]|nr:hypothetical protein N0V90_000328 [Kalmusia sp. IMI 367209]
MASFTKVESCTTMKRHVKVSSARGDLLSKTAPIQEDMTGTTDVRNLTREQRNGLLEGPMVGITREGTLLAYVHKRIIMACSSWANDYILKNPMAKYLTLPASEADPRALRLVFGWMTAPYICGKKVKAIYMGKDTVDACKIFQAADVLGMRPYVTHIASYFHHYISDQTCLMNYDELTVLLDAVQISDPLFKHLAKDLANRRYKQLIPDEEDFAAYLKKQPALSHAMDDIHAARTIERKARKEARTNKYKAARAQYKEKQAQSWQEQEEYKKKVSMLKEKLSRMGGKVIMLTAEEAQLKSDNRL